MPSQYQRPTQYSIAIPAHVAQSPASLAMLMSSVSLSGRGGRAQSMPVEGLRWTLSTRIDQRSIGAPQATKAHSAALGPEYSNIRATATQANSPARPTRPTIELTADGGRGSATFMVLVSAFMAPVCRRQEIGR